MGEKHYWPVIHGLEHVPGISSFPYRLLPLPLIIDYFDAIMKTSVEEIGKSWRQCRSIGLEEIDQPDALLWFIAAVQQYAALQLSSR